MSVNMPVAQRKQEGNPPRTEVKPMPAVIRLPTPERGETSSRGTPVSEVAFEVDDLSCWFGQQQAVYSLDLHVPATAVTAIIGPSGCGKSTFLRCLNRMHELVRTSRLTGQIRLFGEDIYGPRVDPTLVRRRVGMVFQKSNPFPTMTIEENVTVGLRLNGVRRRAILEERMETALRMAALWDEVKDHLDRPGTSLSGGQQQRLCIARALAVQPEVLLMDEPGLSPGPHRHDEN